MPISELLCNPLIHAQISIIIIEDFEMKFFESSRELRRTGNKHLFERNIYFNHPIPKR